jgi:hypothetical protein
VLEELILNPVYWISVVVLVLGGSFLVRARFLDFKFIMLGFISQYAVHAAFAFGLFSEIGMFCALFWVLFVATLTPSVQRVVLRGTSFLRSKSPVFARVSAATTELDTAWRAQLADIEKPWVLVSKWFLILYWGCRLIFYPYMGGAFEISDRLEAGQENRALFFLGLAVVPALAACVAVWIRKGYRFRILDYVVLVIVTVGYLGTGSKAAILPIVLLLFGAISFFKKPLREMKVWLYVAGGAVIVIAVRYIFFFPSAGTGELLHQALYRVAANTDSLEYLSAIGKAPGDYPYAGFGALFPMFLKPFGLDYQYAPGVWLHGTRFGEWAGFGPNPGLVMDYLGNLGWWGLLIPVIAGLYMLGWTRVGGAVGCSFIAITYQLVVDVTLFDIPFALWGAILAGMLAIAWVVRKPVVAARVSRLRRRARAVKQ